MKTFTFLLLSLSIIAAGCSKKPDQNDVAATQQAINKPYHPDIPKITNEPIIKYKPQKSANDEKN
jgi:PBP1b-binding outer membrane lipoprotein LpoB